MKSSGREALLLMVIAVAALIASGIEPYDRLTWMLEVSWVVIGVPILALTWRRFRLTPLLYRLLFLHAIVLIVGGHYTYSHVPLGLWVRDAFDLSRNHYDRLGHFVQGFVPAILVRELLVRRSPLVAGKWLFCITASICLAFSAFFETIEWWAALAWGGAADDYLATQGDVWDTQWDMFLCLIGAIASQLVLSRAHGRQLAQVP